MQYKNEISLIDKKYIDIEYKKINKVIYKN